MRAGNLSDRLFARPVGQRCAVRSRGMSKEFKVVAAKVQCSPGQWTHFQMGVHARNESNSIAKRGFWERQHSMRMATALRRLAAARGVSNGTLLDIGANIGWFTISMAVCGHDVIAVEPMSSNANLIETNVCLNRLDDKVKLVRGQGLATQSGDCVLIASPNSTGDGHSVCDIHKLAALAKGKRPWLLGGGFEARTLDSVLQAAAPGQAIDVLKIDVEGYKLRALSGCSRTRNEGRS